jgi:cell division septation protein DedD
MSSVMKGALNKMTIKQAFDEVNATDEQKKNGLNRLLQSDKKRSFIPQIKRYAATVAAVVVAAGTAGVGIHFAVINNQGGPINVSIGGNSTANSIITPSENTKVHSEKSGMTFVDDKTFWAQLGKITYRRIDNTPTIDTTEINASDDFDSIFCTDKQVQSEMLDLFDNAIDITNKYIVLPDSNAAVGISSDMSVQEIESFKNNSANCFVGTGYYENERFYYADKAYFGFDTSEEFINTVSQVYTGNYSDNFTEDFYDYCPDYIQPADKNNIKSNFGINIDKELPITEPYSAHTQYCAAVYTDESHNSLILLSLTAKEGNNDSKTFELKYIPMKYVDGKLRIVVEIYNTIFMDVNAYSDNFMYNCGMASEIESDAKTVDITSVVSDSDNLSKPEATTVTTTVTTTTSTTTAAASTAPKTESTTAPQTTAAPETTTAEPAPEPTGTATNVTLRMTGNAADLDRSMLYYYKVDKAFLTNDEVITIKQSKISEVPYFNTDGSDHTFDSIDYGIYVIAAPMMTTTGDNGFAVFTVTESSSNSIINIDLTTGTLPADKFEVVDESIQEEDTLPDYSEQQYALAEKSYTYEEHTYIPAYRLSLSIMAIPI